MKTWGRACIAAVMLLASLVGASAPAAAVEGSWSALGGGLNGTVRAVAVSSTGVIYAGGSFTSAGGVAASNIAKWDGTSWSSLGSGANGAVFALAIDGNDSLYVGGAFTQVGGISAPNVAKWNGTSWSALGSIGDYVNELAVDQSNTVYATGGFSDGFATWNGSTWTDVASGLGGSTYALALGASGTVYVGGTIPGRVAQWNRSTWTPLPTVSPVYGLTVSSNNLYAVGGPFVGRWDGSAWASLGGGLSGDLEDVVVGANGSVYAGGETAEGVKAFTGIVWSSLGGGLSGADEEGKALAMTPSGALVVGGSFTTAGGIPASNIAVWTPLGPPVPGPVTADFTYLMPDGGECTAVSPAKVTVGTSVALPTFVPCQGSSDLVGWRIPGQDWAFAPGRTVGVVDSQRFTAVIREPQIIVEYDANVGAADQCLVAGENVRLLENRTRSEQVARASLSDAAFATQAPCQPMGLRLIGWSDRPTTDGSDRVGSGGVVYAPGASLPVSWADGGTEPVNRIRLYAMWGLA